MFAVDNTNLLYILLSSHLSSFVISKATFFFFNSISFIFFSFIAILERHHILNTLLSDSSFSVVCVPL